MAVRIFWIEPSKAKLSATQKRRVVSTIRAHALRAARLLKLPLVNITVLPMKGGRSVIPETAAGGASLAEAWVHVEFDPTRINLALENLPPTVYHELHHLKRGHHPGTEAHRTLAEAVVAEGLGTVFEEEQLPGYTALYGRCSEREVARHLRLFLRQAASKDYNYSEWFFGTGKLPRWLGYKMGAYIVRQAKQKSGLTALQMVGMPAAKVIRLSGIRARK